MTNTIESFADRDRAADAACALLAKALAASPAPRLVATGGTTPGPTYDRLARAPIDWTRASVTLTDERWVDPASPESNAALVRRRLLVGPAGAARLVPLMGRGVSLADDTASAEAAIRALGAFDVTLLGMGPDGHIGSLFPGAPGLAAALDPEGAAWCVAAPTAGQPPFVPRISLTLRAFLASALTVLLITGEEKRELVERVFADAAFAPPVAAILRQDVRPVRVLWAP